MRIEMLNKILDVQELALQDETYLQLLSPYKSAQKDLQELMSDLSTEQLKILEEYLSASVGLHHRLMELAILHK